MDEVEDAILRHCATVELDPAYIQQVRALINQSIAERTGPLGPLPDLATNGVSFLLYGLLEVIIDGYFDAVQSFDDFYHRTTVTAILQREGIPVRLPGIHPTTVPR